MAEWLDLLEELLQSLAHSESVDFVLVSVSLTNDQRWHV